MALLGRVWHTERMTHDDLLALIAAVENKRLAAASKKPWCPPPDQWSDPSPWTAIPAGGAPRLWMHLADFNGWRAARQVLAEAWPQYSGPPTKPVLVGLVLAGELELLDDAARRWPLRCSPQWCMTAFDRLLSAHYDQNAGLPLPLSLGLARWLVRRSESFRGPDSGVSLHPWARLLQVGIGGQEPFREQALLGWWGCAKRLGEDPNAFSEHPRTGNTLLFMAIQKQMWDLAEQLVKDGADPNAQIPQKGNALLTALQKERAGQLAEPDRQRLLGLVFCMLEHGLDWQQPFPFPGQPSFERFLAPASILRRADEHWQASKRESRLDEGLPAEAAPSSPRPKPRF